MAKSVLQIRAIHGGAHHGQDDYMLEARMGDVCAGHLDNSCFQGVPKISFIEVSEGHRRRGIGTALAYALQDAYPGQEIEFGMLTDEGAAWRCSLPMVSVPDRAVVEAGAELELARSERDAPINAATSGDPTDFARLNMLHYRIEGLVSRVRNS
jgi:hypothetical protein